MIVIIMVFAKMAFAIVTMGSKDNSVKNLIVKIIAIIKGFAIRENAIA
jgi:hypothetical protein